MAKQLPENIGTEKRPLYKGHPVRHRGVQRWLKGGPFPSKAAYNEAVRQLKNQIDKELDQGLKPSERTIREYVENTWLKLHPRPKASSNKKLMADIKPFLKKYGDKRFDYFSVDENTYDMRSEWMANQPRGVITAGRAMWNNAVTDRAAPAGLNPFARPGIVESRGRKDIKILKESEVVLLGQCALELYPGEYGKVLRAMVLFAAYTGVRPGEMFALTWDRYRPEEEEADIFEIFDGESNRTKPKTEAGSRTVVVPEQAVEAIAEMPRLDDEFVFVSSRGKTFKKNTFVHYWHSLRALFLAKLPADHFLNVRVAVCVAAGLDPNKVGEGKGNLHLYELRHMGLTRFLELGEWNNVMDVCWQAGHRDPELLYKTYGHPDAARARARLKLLGRRISDEDLNRLTAGE
jgi:integrase